MTVRHWGGCRPPPFPSLSQGENEMRVPIATSAAELFCEGDPRSGGVYNKLGLWNESVDMMFKYCRQTNYIWSPVMELTVQL